MPLYMRFVFICVWFVYVFVFASCRLDPICCARDSCTRAKEMNEHKRTNHLHREGIAQALRAPI